MTYIGKLLMGPELYDESRSPKRLIRMVLAHGTPSCQERARAILTSLDMGGPTLTPDEIHALMDMLKDSTPPGHYFGTNPIDYRMLGYWVIPPEVKDNPEDKTRIIPDHNPKSEKYRTISGYVGKYD